MRCKVSARCVALYQLVLFEEALSASIVAGLKVDLSKEESIIIIICARLDATSEMCDILTCNRKQLVPNVDGGLILMLGHSILPPLLEQLLHTYWRLYMHVQSRDPYVFDAMFITLTALGWLEKYGGR